MRGEQHSNTRWLKATAGVCGLMRASVCAPALRSASTAAVCPFWAARWSAPQPA